MDDKARNRIKIFLNQKEKIGELRDEDLEKMGELGSGNGGVVMKGLCLFPRSINGIFISLSIVQFVTFQPNGLWQEN